MKSGKVRTLTICLDDIPADKIITAGNKKRYVALMSKDFDDGMIRDSDFYIAVQRSKEDIQSEAPRVYVGTGIIHENL